VIDMMEMQKKIAGLGGTMRLGAYPCRLKKNYQGLTEFSSHPVLGTGALKEKYQQSDLSGNIIFRFSEFAWACNVQ